MLLIFNKNVVIFITLNDTIHSFTMSYHPLSVPFRIDIWLMQSISKQNKSKMLYLGILIGLFAHVPMQFAIGKLSRRHKPSIFILIANLAWIAIKSIGQ